MNKMQRTNTQKIFSLKASDMKCDSRMPKKDGLPGTKKKKKHFCPFLFTPSYWTDSFSWLEIVVDR